jgi:hypothetical protein
MSDATNLPATLHCKDCKFSFENPTIGKRGIWDLCGHPSALSESGKSNYLVTGEIKLDSNHFVHCSTARSSSTYSSRCGPTASFYEPIPPPPIAITQSPKSRFVGVLKTLRCWFTDFCH